VADVVPLSEILTKFPKIGHPLGPGRVGTLLVPAGGVPANSLLKNFKGFLKSQRVRREARRRVRVGERERG